MNYGAHAPYATIALAITSDEKYGEESMNRTVSIVFSIFLCSELYADVFEGVEFPDGESSFADAVISYEPSASVSSPYDDPSEALGIPDGSAVSLGDEGVLILKFTDNSLTTSGDTEYDLWIFEAGSAIETIEVYISNDEENWIYVGQTSDVTQTYGIDIDYYIGSGVTLGERYNYVKVIDLLPQQSSGVYEGADIDAIGAISSAEPIDVVEIIVDGGYFNLDITNGNEPETIHCMTAQNYGRMVVDEVNNILYICTQSGWISK